MSDKPAYRTAAELPWKIHGYGLTLHGSGERLHVRRHEYCNMGGKLVQMNDRRLTGGFSSNEAASKWSAGYIKANPGHLSHSDAMAVHVSWVSAQMERQAVDVE